MTLLLSAVSREIDVGTREWFYRNCLHHFRSSDFGESISPLPLDPNHDEQEPNSSVTSCEGSQGEAAARLTKFKKFSHLLQMSEKCGTNPTVT
jgi:hypothetical protein